MPAKTHADVQKPFAGFEAVAKLLCFFPHEWNAVMNSDDIPECPRIVREVLSGTGVPEAYFVILRRQIVSHQHGDAIGDRINAITFFATQRRVFTSDLQWPFTAGATEHVRNRLSQHSRVHIRTRAKFAIVSSQARHESGSSRKACARNFRASRCSPRR